MSTPAFPAWSELVSRLAARDAEPPSAEALRHLQKEYSPDALIQAAKDRLNLDEEEFSSVLAAELYSHIFDVIPRDRSIELFKRAVTSRNIGNLSRTQWQAFIDLLSSYFPSLTALKVAATIAPLFGSPIAPVAILSFNAEPLFSVLINANVATMRGVKGGDVLDLVIHATSNRKVGKVPYVFCHGLLPVPEMPARLLSSVDKLVFSEAAYLALANNSFSWQSASFLRAAGENTMVFVGVSLTDPNMRRWLSWVHSTRIAELTDVGSPAPTSTVHYWIKKSPGDAPSERWIESVVAHLGIRIIWVNDYAEIAATLQTMTN